MKKQLLAIMAVVMGVSVLGCAVHAQSGHETTSDAKPHRHQQAVAVIHPTQGHKVHGIVRFVATDAGLVITVDLEGLTPNSTHGFHIHEYGDCSAPDGSSAGGHYNPEHHPHAGPDAAQRHAGDLGNITTDADGKAHLEITVNDITIDGPHNPILGRAVIVHEKADDYKSQPTGDAGARLGCGVIGLAKD